MNKTAAKPNSCAESAQLVRITNKLSVALRKQELSIPQMIASYEQRRLELGKLLKQIHSCLAPLGLYSRYLKARGIPRRTAYDLVDAVQVTTADTQPKPKPAPYSPEQHRAERYSMLCNQLGIYLDRQEDKHTALEKLCTASLGYPVSLTRKMEVSL